MALPEARVPVPRVVEPSVKVTVPVGAAVPEAGVTVAVKVRLVPLTAVVAEAARVVVVAMPATGGPTVTVMVEDHFRRTCTGQLPAHRHRRIVWRHWKNLGIVFE
jgi:hypothetical protein